MKPPCPFCCSHSRLLVAAFSMCFSLRLLAADPAAAAPEISLSLRGVGEEIVEQGEPLHIAVRLDAPHEFSDAIELAPTNGAWSDAIAVELAPAGGASAVARAEPVGKAATPHATLSASQVAGGLWRLPAEAMQRIAPGEYVVRARLAIPAGRGWTGEVVSDETPIQVAPVSDSADRVTQRTVSLARDALLCGRIQEAATIVDAVLDRTPDDRTLLTLRADIAERAGNPHAAMICLNRFRRSWTEMGAGQPPIELEELRTRILRTLLADEALPANPPAWSWPPPAVLARSADEIPTSTLPSSVVTAPATTVATKIPPVTAPTSSSLKPTESAAPAPSIASATASSSVGLLVSSTELTDALAHADADGQWAASARASSEYSTPRYGARQATGAPDIPLGLAGNSPEAWCPAEKNVGTAWLELGFAKPVHATEVRVRESNAPGAIARIEAIDVDGATHLWWEGVDPFVAPRVREIAWFAVRVPRTEYLVAKVKLSLNLAAVPDWKQIDAVQLVGTAP